MNQEIIENQEIRENQEFIEQIEKEKTKKKKSGKGRKWLKCIAMALVFGIVASVAFQGSNYVMREYLGIGASQKEEKEIEQVAVMGAGENATSDVAVVVENVMPSVVSITNLTVQEVQSFFFGGQTYTQEYENSGSGIIIGQNEDELLIVSNNHVVAESTTLTVTFVDGESVEAQIKGTDAGIDLAVIAVPMKDIKASTQESIKVATIGDSDALHVGEQTIAIGNALGYGQSVTSGIVSALDRSIDGFDTTLIQTDAAINPGNSGGALLNAKGEVIGINTVKMNAEAVEGMGYAIPITDVREVMDELMNRETRTKVPENMRGALGISGANVDETISQLYNMPVGVCISEVFEDTGADKADLPIGGIITALDGVKVNSLENLQELLMYYRIGEKVSLTVQAPRQIGNKINYHEKTYDVVLGSPSTLQ